MNECMNDATTRTTTNKLHTKNNKWQQQQRNGCKNTINKLKCNRRFSLSHSKPVCAPCRWFRFSFVCAISTTGNLYYDKDDGKISTENTSKSYIQYLHYIFFIEIVLRDLCTFDRIFLLEVNYIDLSNKLLSITIRFNNDQQMTEHMKVSQALLFIK